MILFSMIIIVMTSCATVRKSQVNTLNHNKHVDTSFVKEEYGKETTVVEKSVTPVYIKADTTKTAGFLNEADTIGYEQEIETDNLKLKTTVKPKYNNGKKTGYKIKSEAIKKSDTIMAPIDRTIVVKEGKSNVKQKRKSDEAVSSVSETKKNTWRFNFAGVVIVACCVALFLVYKFLKVKI